MNEPVRPASLAQFNMLFSRFKPREVEQFYSIYQRWSLYQRVQELQHNIDTLTAQLDENAAEIECVRPSAIALATLARLQASGVEDVELLDQMLERGEDWLDRTIQHLEYCERMGVIRDDYEEWCRHALEDAFDWIDTVQNAAITTSTEPDAVGETDRTVPVDTVAALSSSNGSGDQPPSPLPIEELFLQKLMSEDGEAAQQPDSRRDATHGTRDEDASTEQTGVSTLEDTTLKLATVGSLSNAPISTRISPQTPDDPTRTRSENGSAPESAFSPVAPTTEADDDHTHEPASTPVLASDAGPGESARQSTSEAVPLTEKDTLVTPIARDTTIPLAEKDTLLTPVVSDPGAAPTANAETAGTPSIPAEPHQTAQQPATTGSVPEDTTGTPATDTVTAPAAPTENDAGPNDVGARFIASAPTEGDAGSKNSNQTTQRRPGFLRRLLLALWR